MASSLADVLLIQTEGGGTEGCVTDLNMWLEQEEAFSTRKTSIVSTNLDGTPMSALAVILVILGTPAAVKAIEKLGDALIAWIRARRPRVTLTVREGTREVRIDTVNPPSRDELAKQLRLLLPSHDDARQAAS